MPADECSDCGAFAEGGMGLKGGRCPSCRAAYLAGLRETPPKLTRPRPKARKEK